MAGRGGAGRVAGRTVSSRVGSPIHGCIWLDAVVRMNLDLMRPMLPMSNSEAVSHWQLITNNSQSRLTARDPIASGICTIGSRYSSTFDCAEPAKEQVFVARSD